MKKYINNQHMSFVFSAIFIASFFLLLGFQANADTIKLKAASTTPSMSPPAQAMTAWAEKIEEMSEGRVDFTFYYASSLFNAADQMRAMRAGIADVSDFWYIEGPTMYPLNFFATLPAMGWPEPYESTRIWREMFDEFPELIEEHKGLKVLNQGLAGEPTTYLNTPGKPIRSVKDLRGVKVISMAGFLAKWWKTLGATPVFIPFEDTYMSVERNLVNAYVSQWGWASGAGVIELTPNRTDMGFPLYMTQNVLVMNPRSWNKLPADVKRVFKDCEAYHIKLRIEGESFMFNRYTKQLKNSPDNHFYKFSPEDIKICLDAAKEIHEELIGLAEQQGEPGRRFYNTLTRKIEAAKN